MNEMKDKILAEISSIIPYLNDSFEDMQDDFIKLYDYYEDLYNNLIKLQELVEDDTEGIIESLISDIDLLMSPTYSIEDKAHLKEVLFNLNSLKDF